MIDVPVFTLERDIAASMDQVWAALSAPSLLGQWYGVGVETVTHGFAFEEGGEWRTEMRFNGQCDHSRILFKTIAEKARLVWLHQSTDADWQKAPSQSLPNWPQDILTTITLAPAGEHTRLGVSMVPVAASLTERVCFVEYLPMVEGGWRQNLARMERLLVGEAA